MSEKKLVEIIPGWATSPAVASYLGVSVQWARKLASQLGAVEITRTAILYPAAAVRQYAASDRKPGRPRRAEVLPELRPRP